MKLKNSYYLKEVLVYGDRCRLFCLLGHMYLAFGKDRFRIIIDIV